MQDKVSVLLVEDEDLIRQDIAFNLQEQGLKCVSAASLTEAKKIIDDGFEPECAIVDLTIPEVSIDEVKGRDFSVNNSYVLINYLKEKSDKRCRIILTTSPLNARILADRFGTWGYYHKDLDDDWNFLGKVLQQGYLSDKELTEPTRNLRSEAQIISRSLEQER
jgi:DNA-binding NtrC family response regulator